MRFMFRVPVIILKTVKHILTLADSNRQEQHQPRSLFFCLLLFSAVCSRVFCDQQMAKERVLDGGIVKIQ